MLGRCLVAALFLLPTLSAHADPVDDFVRAELKRQRIPGAAIAIVRDGKITKASGYGLADLDHRVPVTTDTVFALASITKQFTATLIMRFVEEGKLSLDDEISRFLVDPPALWRGITVRHLLNHTSGLSPLGQDFVSLVRTLNVSTDKMYEAAKADPVSGNPGDKWSYSDVGYFLLGMIIEKVSGKKYDDVLREQILDPLKMSTARIHDLARPYPNLARGYTLVQRGENWEISNIRRDGYRELTSHYGLFGTVKDLAKWDAALSSGAVLKPSSLATMWTATKLNDGSTFQYGFGWGLGKRCEQNYHFHSGITGTSIIRVPSLDLAVIVLTNLGRWAGGGSRGADATMITHGIAALTEPKLRWRPLDRQDATRAAQAREVFDSLMAGRLPTSILTADAINFLTEVVKEFASWYCELGAVQKVELVDQTQEAGETVSVFQFTFARGSRVFGLITNSSGKVTDFFPDA